MGSPRLVKATTTSLCAAPDCGRYIHVGDWIGKIYDLDADESKAWAHARCMHRYANRRTGVSGGTAPGFGTTTTATVVELAVMKLKAGPAVDDVGDGGLWRDRQAGIVAFKLKRAPQVTLDKLVLAIFMAADGVLGVDRHNPMPGLIAAVEKLYYFDDTHLHTTFREQLISIVRAEYLREGLDLDAAYELLRPAARLADGSLLAWLTDWRNSHDRVAPELAWFDHTLATLTAFAHQQDALEDEPTAELPAAEEGWLENPF